MKNYRDINDYELLYLIKDGNDYYENVIFEKYKAFLNSICSKYYKKYFNLHLDYDDLYQESLVGFMNAIRNYSDSNSTKFFTYLVICVESKIKDYITKNSRKKSVMLSNSISLYAEVGDNIFLNDIISCDNNSFIDLEILIDFKNSLSMKESEVFELKLNGFSGREISVLLDDKVTNIYSCIRQIKIKFNNFNVLDCIL